jgi:type VI protein secretion system component VasK
MTEPFSFKATIAFFLSVWARSAILFWCLAVACLVFLIALVAGAHWQLGDTPALLAAYGTILGLALPVLLVFAAFKTYSERPPPVLSLLPQDAAKMTSKTGFCTTPEASRKSALNRKLRP